MIITRNGEYVIWESSKEEFYKTTLPSKGWSEYAGVWPIPSEPQPIVIPEAITMRQARLILLQYGLLDTVTVTVNTIGGAAAIEWEYAGTVDRNNPLVAMVAAGAGMTDAQIDTMFTEGSLL